MNSSKKNCHICHTDFDFPTKHHVRYDSKYCSKCWNKFDTVHTRQCRKFKEGSCLFNLNCKYSHPAFKTCKFWTQSGNCKFGLKCHFSHPMICPFGETCTYGKECEYFIPENMCHSKKNDSDSKTLEFQNKVHAFSTLKVEKGSSIDSKATAHEKSSLVAQKSNQILKSSNSQTFGQKQEDECCICMVANKEYVFTGCGHLCVCSKCYQGLMKCPICRAPGTAIKLFKA